VKFVSLMREKADLLEMLEEHKLLLVNAAQRMEATGGRLLLGIVWYGMKDQKLIYYY